MIIPCMTICVMIMIMVTAGISSNFDKAHSQGRAMILFEW